MRQLRVSASLASVLCILVRLSTATAAVSSTCSAGDATSCASPSHVGQAGLALMQRAHSVRAVDIGAGLSEPNLSSTEAKKVVALVTPRQPALVPGAGQLVPDLPASEPTKAKEAKSEALVAEIEAPRVPAYVRSASVGLKESSGFGLDGNDHGGGLSETVDYTQFTSAARGIDKDADNSSIPPITTERFEPFGYPGAGLLLELHLPETTLRQLHSTSRGSLAEFLVEVREEICKSDTVPPSRISILGIHGRYKRFNNPGLFNMASEHTGSTAGAGTAAGPPAHIAEEVVVRFEILPGWTDDPDPKTILTSFERRLSSSDSDLMTGPLGTIFLNASVTMSTPAGAASSEVLTIEHRGMAHMSAMAWPIGISAAFIGILIWLAAY